MAKLYSYTLEHFFRDFTEEEIVDGLELALSSPLSDFQERANAGILRTHGIPYFSKEKLGCWYDHGSHNWDCLSSHIRAL